ncbi:hypothetical protein [Xanthobacter sp. 126]|uniref:hypothetical protein n=1 Tax=Xanthobacter sp. 126 TaxID=1131814 RepID=UPI00045EB639|nr:hypothetical protein [Xanthobacter sp. 126]
MPGASRLAPRSAPLLLWGDVQDAQALRQERARLLASLRRCPPFARRRAYLEIRLAEVTARLIAAELEAGRDLILRRD